MPDEPDDWQKELDAYIRRGIAGLHEVIEKYLTLMDWPAKVPVSDLETIVQMASILKPPIERKFLLQVCAEFITFHGYNPVPVEDDEFFIKLR